jgi:pilus assembly protein TadC
MNTPTLSWPLPTALLALLLTASAGVLLTAGPGRRRGAARARVAALLPDRSPQAGRAAPFKVLLRRWAPRAGAAAVGFLLVGGTPGLLAGVAAACAVRHLQRRRARTPAETGEEGLALAADLLAACAAAGASPREAAEAVGEAVGGPVGARLLTAAARLRLGGEPTDAWAPLADTPGARGLVHCLVRADATGAPAAEPVARLAHRLRADRARAATARARRAQVLITAPVGLCFLPAFLAIGVAPVVIGLAGGLLGGT